MKYTHTIFAFLLLGFTRSYATSCADDLFECNNAASLESAISSNTYCKHPISSSDTLFAPEAPLTDTYITIGNQNSIIYKCTPEQIILPISENPSETLIEAEHNTASNGIGVPNRVLFKFTKRVLSKEPSKESLSSLTNRYVDYIAKQKGKTEKRLHALSDLYTVAKRTSQIEGTQYGFSSNMTTKCKKIVREDGAYKIVGSTKNGTQLTFPSKSNQRRKDLENKLSLMRQELLNLQNLINSYDSAAGLVNDIYLKTPSKTGIQDKNYLLKNEIFHTLYPANVKVSSQINERCEHGLLRKYLTTDQQIMSLCIGESVNGIPITDYNTFYKDTKGLKPIITPWDLIRRKAYRAPHCFIEQAIKYATKYLMRSGHMSHLKQIFKGMYKMGNCLSEAYPLASIPKTILNAIKSTIVSEITKDSDIAAKAQLLITGIKNPYTKPVNRLAQPEPKPESPTLSAVEYVPMNFSGIVCAFNGTNQTVINSLFSDRAPKLGTGMQNGAPALQAMLYSH